MTKSKEIVKVEKAGVPAEVTNSIFAALDKYQEQHQVYEPGFMINKPNKGTTTFQIGSLTTAESPIEAIILANDTRRSLWPFGSEKEVKDVKGWTGKRPLCSSRNCGGIVGEPPKLVDPDCPAQAKEILGAILNANCHCKQCLWNTWRDTGGKACKETRALLLWMTGLNMPALISVTPSSLKFWRGYITSLPGQRTDRLVTEISTTSIPSDYGDYNVLDFKPMKVKGAIAPIPDDALLALSQQVSYGTGACMVLEALLAEFADVEIEEEFDYPNGNGTPATIVGVDDDSDVPFTDSKQEF